MQGEARLRRRGGQDEGSSHRGGFGVGRRARSRRGGRAGCAAQAQAWLVSIGLVRRARLYPPIQLYSVIARQGPPAHLTNRGGSRELGFLPGLLGIAHGIAHEVAHGIAETHGTTYSDRTRGPRHPRSAHCDLGAGTRIDGSPLGEDRRLRTPHPGLHKRRGERRVEAPRPTLKEKESRDWKGLALTSWRVSRTAHTRAGLRLHPHPLAYLASVLSGAGRLLKTNSPHGGHGTRWSTRSISPFLIYTIVHPVLGVVSSGVCINNLSTWMNMDLSCF